MKDLQEKAKELERLNYAVELGAHRIKQLEAVSFQTVFVSTTTIH